MQCGRGQVLSGKTPLGSSTSVWDLSAGTKPRPTRTKHLGTVFTPRSSGAFCQARKICAPMARHQKFVVRLFTLPPVVGM